MEYKGIFLKQAIMRKVLISLIPITLFSVYLFGLRVLLVIIISNVFGLLTEYVMLRSIDSTKVKISEAVFVTSTLYALTLPPGVPIWVCTAGIIFGVLFAKMVFGGFGRNIFNPALVGRCFIYISFPAFMTNSWMKPFGGFPGGFAKFMNSEDAITNATPIYSFFQEGKVTGHLDLFIGNISGSIGETSFLLILLAAVYLIYTKTASHKIMFSSVLSFVGLSFILYITGVTKMDPLYGLMSGGVLFGIIFMATDPISAPKIESSKIIYGILIGSLTVVIRLFSVFTEGIMFAILIANVFASLIDLKTKEIKSKKVVTK